MYNCLFKRAPIAVGKAHLSGEDMYMSAMKGKCLHILHIYTDSLWSQGDQSIQVPLIPSQAKESTEQSEVQNAEESKASEMLVETSEGAEQVKEMIGNLKIEDEKESKRWSCAGRGR